MWKVNLTKRAVGLFFCLLLCNGAQLIMAEEHNPSQIPTRYGVATQLGNTVDPDTDTSFVGVTGFAMWDYDRIWRHWAPAALRFKIEASAGTTLSPKQRIIAGVGMMALYYLEPWSTRKFRPYLEGGIGGIYTDFRLKGQGSRFNFNSQLGFGAEFGPPESRPYFAALRFSHISNAGLADDNRGINSFYLLMGRYF